MHDSGWRKTRWTVVRRYCKHCCKQYSAQIPGVLPKEQLGNTIIAQMAVMRNLGISYGKIQKLILMIYGKHIDISTLERAYCKAASQLRPLYDRLQQQLVLCNALGGDETGWFMNGEHYWVWVMISQDIAFYYISTTRRKLVPEAFLAEFEGITVSDSYGGWNSVGRIHQKCLLHYFRDMYRTLEKNDSAQFKSFFEKLRQILKDSISEYETHMGKDGRAVVPARTVAALYKRIEELAYGSYTDKDCNRYAKRLRREGDSILTFLKHDVTYHNNASKRALRIFATMRKILYGSRSESGMMTTETLATIYATCELRRVNPYHFIRDYLDGIVDDIPMPAIQAPVVRAPIVQMPVAV